MLPELNTPAMQLLLDKFAATLPADERAAMVIDQAGWHTADELAVPRDISLVLLPLGWTAPRHLVPRFGCRKVEQEPSMTEITRIAVDTSKSVFTLHGVDAAGRVLLRRNLRRCDFLAFFEKLPPVEVVLEACGGSHHWGRELRALGHQVRLLPAQYVQPFVKRSKNDRNDAEAINVAASQPSIHAVAVKSVAQQAKAMLLSVRELLVRQHTQLVNALRGHAAELGIVAPLGGKGLAQLQAEVAAADEAAVPTEAKEAPALLAGEAERIAVRLTNIDAKLMAQHKANPVSRRLAAIPGVGPITALSFALRVDAGQFRSARHLAAWLGLTPRERSTAGKQRLGGISRAGDERLRALLVIGATAVIRHAQTKRPGSSAGC